MRTAATVPSAYNPRASSAGSASPARLKPVTLGGTAPVRSSSAAAVGTMTARRIPSPATEGSSSAFSTSTSLPPHASVPKSSATDTSKLIDVENRVADRSSSDTLSRSQCSRTTTDEWRIITPLGRPVDPEVKTTCDRFPGSTPVSGAASGSAATAARAASSASARAPSGSAPARAEEVRTRKAPASSSIQPSRSRGYAGSSGT